MKSSRRYFGVVVLILMLVTPIFAGDIHTMNPSQPPPSAPATTEGDIHTGVAGDITTMNADAEAAGGSVTGAVVSFVQSVLSLL
jgi:hypothetical protein